MFWIILTFALATVSISVGSIRLISTNAGEGWHNFNIGVLLYVIVYWQYATMACKGVI